MTVDLDALKAELAAAGVEFESSGDGIALPVDGGFWYVIDPDETPACLLYTSPSPRD